MNRISLQDDLVTVITKFSEGNPGCATALCEMLEKKSMTEFLPALLFFDINEIYGSKIYMIWNDCCDRDVDKVYKTIDYLRKNNISKEKIHENLNRGRALPFIN